MVLAAGRGLRFGGDMPKPLTADFAAGRSLAYAVDAALASGLAPVVVVVSDDRVAAAAGRRASSGRNPIVRNDAPERGIASSLQRALRALTPDERSTAVVVGLADQPLVGAEAYRRVAARSTTAPDSRSRRTAACGATRC